MECFAWGPEAFQKAQREQEDDIYYLSLEELSVRPIEYFAAIYQEDIAGVPRLDYDPDKNIVEIAEPMTAVIKRY